MPTIFQGLTDSQLAALLSAITLGAGAIGYFIDRLLRRAGPQERIAHLNTLADLISKMQASGMSVKDIKEFEGRVSRSNITTASEIVAAVSSDEETSDLHLPDQYWTTVAMGIRAGARLRRADAELDEVLADLGTMLSEHEATALAKADRAWHLYRERAMAYAASEYYPGTMAPLVGTSHGIALTEERIELMRADLADRKRRYG